MEASRRLELVVNNDGEVVSREEKCEHCAGYERDLKGKRLQIARLERELANAQGAEPEAQDVRQVLDYWADRVTAENWWHRRPSYRPADQRWTAVRGRLKDGRTLDDCRLAVDGALLGNPRQVKREWVDAQSIFRNNENFERHLERALDPAQEWVRKVAEVPVPLRERWQDVLDAAAMCDCGHLRFDHAKWDPLREGRAECLVHGCHCLDWDDSMQRADEYIRRHAPLARRQGGG